VRYFDLELSPGHGAVHPADDQLAAAPDVARQALLGIDSFCDGSAILFYRLRGDPDAAVAALEGAPGLQRREVVTGDCGLHLAAHLTVEGLSGSLLELVHDHPVLVDTPVTFTDDAVVVTVVGAQDPLQRALAAIPDDVSVSIRQVGRYGPEDPDVLSLLTGRQREVFEAAVDRGYYDVPRRTDGTELAALLDMAPSTLDEHLRKAESRMLSALLGSPSTDADRAGGD
jgi:predicted DNA binding protein